MNIINVNRESVYVSAADRRVVQKLINIGVARLGDFETGYGRLKRNEARDVATEYNENPCGVRIYWRHTQYGNTPARVIKWFAKNPRNQYCVSGNLKRMRKVWSVLNES